MICTESLTKYFGNRCAVHNVSIEINERQIVGFLGLNGAGKTTTLRMLAGLLSPSSGNIIINHRDITEPGAFQARANIGFLPDRPPLYDEMSVYEYLRFCAYLRHYPGSKHHIDEIMNMTGLTHLAQYPIRQLSHGYRQRVGIAQAIVHKPTLVILDEPTSGLDPQQVVEMRHLIRALKEKHTVLLSSHNLTEVGECCDEILLLHEGKLEAHGTAEELTRKLSKQQSLEVVVIGKLATIRSTLASMKSVGHISQALETTLPHDEGLHLNITTIRSPEALAQAFFTAGLGIRQLQPATSQLETLFGQLIKNAH